MKILVVGATGKTGELAWRKAVAEGHDVTVFGRSVARRYKDDPVRKMQGDVLDRSAVTAAIAGQDAVLVCLGPVNSRDRVTLTQGARNICQVMRAEGVERVVFISAAGVGESWRLIPWYSKLLFSTFLKTVLQEHGSEEKIFAESGLIWTAVRAAVLTNRPAGGSVLASNIVSSRTIPRGDLAAYLVSEVTSDQNYCQPISVTAG